MRIKRIAPDKTNYENTNIHLRGDGYRARIVHNNIPYYTPKVLTIEEARRDRDKLKEKLNLGTVFNDRENQSKIVSLVIKEDNIDKGDLYSFQFCEGLDYGTDTCKVLCNSTSGRQKYIYISVQDAINFITRKITPQEMLLKIQYSAIAAAIEIGQINENIE